MNAGPIPLLAYGLKTEVILDYRQVKAPVLTRPPSRQGKNGQINSHGNWYSPRRRDWNLALGTCGGLTPGHPIAGHKAI